MRLHRGRVGALPSASIGSGPPVVLLAGLTPSTGVHRTLLTRATLAPFTALAASGREVHVLNRRPRLPRGMTFAAMAAEHAEALRARFPGPVDVMGVSTGGSLAQQLAADHPDVVGRLVLLSTASRLPPPTRELQRRVAVRIRAGAHGQALALLAASPVGTARRRDLPAALAGRCAGRLVVRDPQDLDDLATTIEAEDPFDLARAGRPIAAPTLIVGGGADRFYPAAAFTATAQLIPDSRVRVLAGRGHVSALSDPRCGNALARFLSPAA